MTDQREITIDISMYPLREEYIAPIDRFIELVNGDGALKVVTTPTSTIVQGPSLIAMAAVQSALLQCYEEFGRAVFVVKYIPDYRALD